MQRAVILLSEEMMDFFPSGGQLWDGAGPSGPSAGSAAGSAAGSTTGALLVLAALREKARLHWALIDCLKASPPDMNKRPNEQKKRQKNERMIE